MKKLLIATVLSACVAFDGAAIAAQQTTRTEDYSGPLKRAALQAARASRSVMLAVASAGTRLLAAGERGIVVWSDDGAKTWQQAQVPVSVTLTAMSFPSPQQGWAVGHAGVVLHTADGGLHWTLQLDGRAAAQIELKAARAAGEPKRVALAEQLVGDGPDKPFLDVHFWNEQRGVAIGAYGLIFGTEDGGKTWTSWFDRLDNPKGLHLNALYAAGDFVMLVGEQGLLLRSVDGAQHFERLDSPYKGSWFTVIGQGDQLAIGGLRGNVFWSADRGRSFTASQVPMPVTVINGLAERNGTWLFVNQAGLLLTSRNQGRSLQPVKRPPGPPLTALVQSADGTLVAASFAGALPLGAQP